MESKVGICVLEGTLDAVRTAVAAGVDYCELPAWTMLMGEEGQFRELKAALKDAGANIETCNLFIPPRLRLNGPDRSFSAITQHVDKVLERMSELGVQLAGFGSGPARNLEPGYPVEKAMDELEEVFRYASDRAVEHDIVLALEPLRKVETNIFNSLLDGAEFIRSRDLKNLRLMADNLHMMTHCEPFGNVREVADLLVHVHLSDNARIPTGFGRWQIWPFLSELKAVGYEGRYSIEVFWNDMAEQSAPAVNYIRQTLRAIDEAQSMEGVPAHVII